MHDHTPNGTCGAEAGAERRYYVVFDAFGRYADDDSTIADASRGLTVIQSIRDAFVGKLMKTAFVVEEYLESAAVEPNVWAACALERGD